MIRTNKVGWRSGGRGYNDMSTNINTKEACVYPGFRESVSAHVAKGESNRISQILEGGSLLQVGAECARCGSRYRCLVRGGKVIDGSANRSKNCDL